MEVRIERSLVLTRAAVDVLEDGRLDPVRDWSSRSSDQSRNIEGLDDQPILELGLLSACASQPQSSVNETERQGVNRLHFFSGRGIVNS
jgi:hypothetical protein